MTMPVVVVIIMINSLFMMKQYLSCWPAKGIDWAHQLQWLCHWLHLLHLLLPAGSMDSVPASVHIHLRLRTSD